MKQSYRVIAGLLSFSLLAGCMQKEDKHREPPPVKDTAFGDMVGTMDKARSVEGTGMQHKADIDKSLNATEGGSEEK